MKVLFPDAHFPLVLNAPLETDRIAEQKILEDTQKEIKKFFALLRDHDAFAPTTLSALLNRWGVIRPPEETVFPEIFLLNLIPHLWIENNLDKKKFVDGLLSYLCIVRTLGISFTEWIFRKLPLKIVIWVRRRHSASFDLTGKYIWKNYIYQFNIPSLELPGLAVNVSGIDEYEYRDGASLLKIDLSSLAHSDHHLINEKLNNYTNKQFNEAIANLISNPYFDYFGGHSEFGKYCEEKSKFLLQLLLSHNLIPYWTDIIYIPSAGNISPTGIQEGAGGLILFENLELRQQSKSSEIHFIELLDRVKYLHGLVQHFYSFFVLQDRKRVHLYYALRSAIAAIMSRNMSHNIGSHVQNYLSNPDYFVNLEDFWL